MTTTTLLILTTILLALAGLAIMTLTNRLENAEAIRVKYVIQINNLARKLEEAQEAQYKAAEQLNDFQHDAYIREQIYQNNIDEITAARDNAENAARRATIESKDNEWLYNDTLNDLHEACRELEALQEEHKNTIEGYEYQTELQARKIAKQADHIIKLEAERSGMSRHQLKLHQQITKLEKELEAYYTAEADLTEAIAAAEEASTESEEEEAPIHIDEKKGWICIGEWARLIVYKHNIYQPYVQHGLGAKIERTKRSDLTAKAQDRYNALKAALKN